MIFGLESIPTQLQDNIRAFLRIAANIIELLEHVRARILVAESREHARLRNFLTTSLKFRRFRTTPELQLQSICAFSSENHSLNCAPPFDTCRWLCHLTRLSFILRFWQHNTTNFRKQNFTKNSYAISALKTFYSIKFEQFHNKVWGIPTNGS